MRFKCNILPVRGAPSLGELPSRVHVVPAKGEKASNVAYYNVIARLSGRMKWFRVFAGDIITSMY